MRRLGMDFTAEGRVRKSEVRTPKSERNQKPEIRKQGGIELGRGRLAENWRLGFDTWGRMTVFYEHGYTV